MINIQDLNIEEEIFPLFDFTHNFHSGEAVREIFTRALNTKEEILFRQQILKGFISNQPILGEYSFSRFDLSEIHQFLESFHVESISAAKMRMKFLFSNKERNQKMGRLILLVRLFHAIDSDYLSRINIKQFPDEYASGLEQMRGFFSDFNLDRYETAFRKNKFGNKHIVELILIIGVKTGNGKLAAFWNQWFLFEAYLSVSRGIIRHDFKFPIFDDAIFSMEGFYHPVLKQPVKNDLTAYHHVILLTGPNMSGKSTLLKAVSLCVYLGHIGLAVPAAKATIPFFKTISVAINLTDSIVSGYSHFMSEIITLKNVLEESSKDTKCFAVFDELFRGTNIEDALDISSATIKGLANFPNTLFFISTHLHQLKNLEEIKSNEVTTLFIECELAGNTPAFTYKLKEGWSDLKLGRVLFEKEGLYKMLKRSNHE